MAYRQLVSNEFHAPTYRNKTGRREDAVAEERRATRTPVTTLMSRDVLMVPPDMPVDQLMQLFLERRISGAPVVDEANRPIGVVSKTDLIRTSYENDGTLEFAPYETEDSLPISDPMEHGFHLQAVEKTVGDVMTPIAYRISARSVVSEAAALMAFENIHRVPVVDDHGKVIGLLSSLDVLRWIAEEEGYLRHRRDGDDPGDNGGNF